MTSRIPLNGNRQAKKFIRLLKTKRQAKRCITGSKRKRQAKTFNTPSKRKRQETIRKTLISEKPLSESKSTEAFKSSSRAFKPFNTFKNLTGSLDKVTPACEVICRELEQVEDVVKAFCGYTVAAPDMIKFMCITKKPKANHKKSKNWQNFCIEYRTIANHNKEDEYLVEKDLKSIEQKDDQKIKDEIEGVISVKRKEFVKEHSNLIDMYACKLKSTEGQVKVTHCIVFLVKCKGLIPLGENLLPSLIGNFQTDVREAYFVRKVGGQPTNFHKNIKNGCEIGATIKNTVNSGTICLFVNYRNEGLKGMTCAHVLMNDSELEKVKQNLRDFPAGRVCTQPAHGVSRTCGNLRRVKFTDRCDVALFDIDESRKPTGGDFPDNTDIPLLNYSSCDVLDHEDIAVGMDVYKYGKHTGVTKGKISAINKTTVIGDDTIKGVLEVCTLNNRPFSESGDSGALLFKRKGNDEAEGVGILVGGHKRRDYAIPLITALRSFGNCTPWKFKRKRRIKSSLPSQRIRSSRSSTTKKRRRKPTMM